MIFEELSLEYWLAGKPLPWNKHANPDKTSAIIFEGELDVLSVPITKSQGPVMPNMVLTPGGSVYMIEADTSKAKTQAHRYFNLKNW